MSVHWRRGYVTACGADHINAARVPVELCCTRVPALVTCEDCIRIGTVCNASDGHGHRCDLSPGVHDPARHNAHVGSLSLSWPQTELAS